MNISENIADRPVMSTTKVGKIIKSVLIIIWNLAIETNEPKNYKEGVSIKIPTQTQVLPYNLNDSFARLYFNELYLYS